MYNEYGGVALLGAAPLFLCLFVGIHRVRLLCTECVRMFGIIVVDTCEESLLVPVGVLPTGCCRIKAAVRIASADCHIYGSD